MSIRKIHLCVSSLCNQLTKILWFMNLLNNLFIILALLMTWQKKAKKIMKLIWLALKNPLFIYEIARSTVHWLMENNKMLSICQHLRKINSFLRKINFKQINPWLNLIVRNVTQWKVHHNHNAFKIIHNNFRNQFAQDQPLFHIYPKQNMRIKNKIKKLIKNKEAFWKYFKERHNLLLIMEK